LFVRSLPLPEASYVFKNDGEGLTDELGEMDELGLIDGLCDDDGDTDELGLIDGDIDELGETDGDTELDGETDGDTDDDGETDGDTELDGETDGDTDDDGETDEPALDVAEAISIAIPPISPAAVHEASTDTSFVDLYSTNASIFASNGATRDV